jgi:hypothetical protein
VRVTCSRKKGRSFALVRETERSTTTPIRSMVFTGTLKKKSDILPLWNYRYFILNSFNELEYYEYENGPQRGVYQLTKTTKVKEYPFQMMENTFRIKDRRVKFELFLWAKSHEMMMLWINALKGSIERIEFKKLGSLPRIRSNISPPPSPRGQEIACLSNQMKSSSQSPSSTLSQPSTPPHPRLSSPSSTSTPSKYQPPENSIIGQCQCNAIQFSINSLAPVAQGYCHCRDCQQSSSGPFTCLLIFPSDAITLLKGNVFLGKYPLTYQRNRYFCRQCSSYLMFDFSSAFPRTQVPSSLSSSRASPLPSRLPSSFVPSTQYTAVLCGAIPQFPFQPSCHVMYSDKKMAMPDCLPKYQSYPPSWGGQDPTEVSEV